MKTIINNYKSFMRIGTDLFCVVDNVEATETLILNYAILIIRPFNLIYVSCKLL